MWNSYINESEIDYEVFILVSKGYATYKELRDDYSVDDILDMMEIYYLSSDLDEAGSKDAEIAAKNKQ